jgi:hypothetical protein
MRTTYEFKKKGDGYRLYFNDEPTNMRIYPVQRGDEPVMLSPDGRIVSSIVWYGEGGPEEDNPGKRRYDLEETALTEELERIDRWFYSSPEGADYFPDTVRPAYKPVSKDCFMYILEYNDAQIDTGFTIEKSDEGWNILYDGAVWGVSKTWDNVYSVMNHIKYYIGDIISKGRTAFKEFIAYYTWKDNDESKLLFDHGKATGVFVKPGPGGFFCHYDGNTGPEDVFPTLLEAKIEATLRYTGDKFQSLIDDITIEPDEDEEE